MAIQNKDWYTSTDVGVRIENSNGPVVTTDEVAVEITGTQAHKSFKSLTDALEEKVDVGAAVTSVVYDQTNKKIVAYKESTPTDVVTVAKIKEDLNLAKSDVGLGNVDNTSDANKPISTAAQAALNAKVAQTEFDGHVNDTDNPHQVTAAQVGLGNVDNTADADKDVNSAVKDGDGNVITETYEPIAQAVASHTALQSSIDAVSILAQNLTGLEGTNFGGFSLDAVEATAISNIATIYTNAGYTSGDVYWFLAGTDMSALKAYRYDGSGSPVAISSTVYDFTDFSGLQTQVSSYRGNTNDLDSLNTLASAGTYQYISGNKMGLVSVSYDTAHSAATQIWLSDVIPDEADPTIWNEGPAILMRTYKNNAWSAWQNPIAKNAADIAALGPKIEQVEGQINGDFNDTLSPTSVATNGYMNYNDAVGSTNIFIVKTPSENARIAFYPCVAGRKYVISVPKTGNSYHRVINYVSSTLSGEVSANTYLSGKVLDTIGTSEQGSLSYTIDEAQNYAYIAIDYDVRGGEPSVVEIYHSDTLSILNRLDSVEQRAEEIDSVAEEIKEIEGFSLPEVVVTEFIYVDPPARSDGSSTISSYFKGYKVDVTPFVEQGYLKVYFRGANFTTSNSIVRGLFADESGNVLTYVQNTDNAVNSWLTLDIPSNAKYLYASYCTNVAGGEVWTPSEVKFLAVNVAGRIGEIEGKIEDIDEIKEIVLGKENTNIELAYSQTFFPLDLSVTIPQGTEVTVAAPGVVTVRTNRSDSDYQTLQVGKNILDRDVTSVKSGNWEGTCTLTFGAKPSVSEKISALTSRVETLEGNSVDANKVATSIGVSYRSASVYKLRPIKILGIGNSWTGNSMSIMPQILDNLGIPYELYRAYAGSASFETYNNNIATESAAFELYSLSTTGSTLIGTSSFKDILKHDNWDIITLQQASGKSGQYSTFQPYINNILEYQKQVNLILPLVYFNVTWAYPNGSSSASFPSYESDSDTMYDAILAAYTQAIQATGIKDVFLTTPVLQQIRQISGISNVDTNDGTHLDAVGQYAVSCLWVDTLLMKYYNRKSVNNKTILDCTINASYVSADISSQIRTIVHNVVLNMATYLPILVN